MRSSKSVYEYNGELCQKFEGKNGRSIIKSVSRIELSYE